MMFLEFLTFRGIRWKRASGRGEVWIACPFCNDDQLRLGLNYQKNIGHCFRGTCGWKSRRAVPQILKQLKTGEMVFSDVGLVEGEDEPKEKIELPPGFFLLNEVSKSDGSLLYTPRRYLLKRGVTKEQIARHYVGATLQGRMRYRIVIPVHFNRKLLGLVCRDYTGNAEPKYLNSKGDKYVYNVRMRKKKETGPIILSEGCIKAWAIERESPHPSGALLGHSVSELQMEQLIEANYREVILFSDPDTAGIRGTLAAAQKFADDRFRVSVVYPIPTKQADDFPPEELRATLANVRPWSITLANRLQKEATDE